MHKRQPTTISDIISPNTPINNKAKARNQFNRLSSNKLKFTAVVIIILVCLAALYSYKHFISDNSLVPASIRKSVNFTVYYPNPKKLPKGYFLNTNSFSANNTAVIYTVSYGNNQKLVFSVQKKPSSTDISSFYNKYVPLNITFKTNVGTATLGAIDNQSLISVPTYGNAWVLITGPINTNQRNFRLVAQSLAVN